MIQTERLGAPISRGIGIGTPFFLAWPVPIVPSELPPHAPEAEWSRLTHAIQTVSQEIKRLQILLAVDSVREGVQILETQLTCLQDPHLLVTTRRKIFQESKKAEHALEEVLQEYQARLHQVNRLVAGERMRELKDLVHRLIASLSISLSSAPAPLFPEGSILCCSDLSSWDVASADPRKIVAIVTEFESPTSHAAIVARAKEIPMISGIDLLSLKSTPPSTVIVDGRNGKLILNPSKNTLHHYTNLQQDIASHFYRLKGVEREATTTLDGSSVTLSINLDAVDRINPNDIAQSDGVGLFRSEYLCLKHQRIPNEEEQYCLYRGVVEQMQGKPIVIRTFDFCSDKWLDHSGVFTPPDSPLGYRATRFLLKERHIFKTHLRAILRASAHGNIRILFPMISTLADWREAHQMVQKTAAELGMDGKIPLGCMVETPSAALIADVLAKECDFLSIGTNDLVQYVLAIDRNDPTLYKPHHPVDLSILRLLRGIVSASKRAQVPLAVCGEMAADPRFVFLLIGIGISSFSMPSPVLPFMKEVVRTIDRRKAHRFAQRALKMSDPEKIFAALQEEYQKYAPYNPLYSFNEGT